MTTVAAFLDACRADIGYMETPVNINRYSTALHRGAEPWCADFLVAKADETGLHLPEGVHGTAYTPTALAEWRKADRSPRDPLPGDWVYFDFPGHDPVDHVGVLVSATASSVTTIDGNTIPDGETGDQANGGEVCLKTRPRSLVAGYGRPDYTPASSFPSIGDLFMDLGPRATARMLYMGRFGHEPDANTLDHGHFFLGQVNPSSATRDVDYDNALAFIYDHEVVA